MKTALCICSQPSLSNDLNTESVEGWDEDPSVLLREPSLVLGPAYLGSAL